MSVVLKPDFNATANEQTENWWWCVLGVFLGVLVGLTSYIGLELLINKQATTSKWGVLAWLAYPFYGLLLLAEWAVRRSAYGAAVASATVLNPVHALSGNIGEGVASVATGTVQTTRAVAGF